MRPIAGQTAASRLRTASIRLPSETRTKESYRCFCFSATKSRIIAFHASAGRRRFSPPKTRDRRAPSLLRLPDHFDAREDWGARRRDPGQDQGQNRRVRAALAMTSSRPAKAGAMVEGPGEGLTVATPFHRALAAIEPTVRLSLQRRSTRSVPSRPLSVQAPKKGRRLKSRVVASSMRCSRRAVIMADHKGSRIPADILRL